MADNAPAPEPAAPATSPTKKRSPNRHAVEEAINDDSSMISLAPAKMEELIDGRKRKKTVCIVPAVEDWHKSKIRLNKVVRQTLQEDIWKKVNEALSKKSEDTTTRSPNAGASLTDVEFDFEMQLFEKERQQSDENWHDPVTPQPLDLPGSSTASLSSASSQVQSERYSFMQDTIWEFNLVGKWDRCLPEEIVNLELGWSSWQTQAKKNDLTEQELTTKVGSDLSEQELTELGSDLVKIDFQNMQGTCPATGISWPVRRRIVCTTIANDETPLKRRRIEDQKSELRLRELELHVQGLEKVLATMRRRVDLAENEKFAAEIEIDAALNRTEREVERVERMGKSFDMAIAKTLDTMQTKVDLSELEKIEAEIERDAAVQERELHAQNLEQEVASMRIAKDLAEEEKVEAEKRRDVAVERMEAEMGWRIEAEIERDVAVKEGELRTQSLEKALASMRKATDLAEEEKVDAERARDVAVKEMEAEMRWRAKAEIERDTVLKTRLSAKKGDEDETCKICYDAAVNAVFVPCGHILACMKCAETLSRKPCPVCRRKVTKVLKTFKS